MGSGTVLTSSLMCTMQVVIIRMIIVIMSVLSVKVGMAETCSAARSSLDEIWEFYSPPFKSGGA